MRAPLFALGLLIALSPLSACRVNADAAELRVGTSARGGDANDPDSDGSAVVAECVAEKYPCSWAEVPETVRAQSYRIGALVANYLATADSIAQVVELLEKSANITDVASGELGVRFRIIGSRPILVALPNDSANPRLSSPMTTVPVKNDIGAGQRSEPAGVTGKPDSAKTSLFLAPFSWENNIFDGRKEPLTNNKVSLDLILEKGGADLALKISRGVDVGARRRFFERPTVATNELESDVNVTLEHFKHWDDYSYVFLTTHGQTVTRGGVRMTYLYAGHVTGKFLVDNLDPFLLNSQYMEALREPGVEFSFTGRTGMRQAEGFLNSADVQDCLFQDFVAKNKQIRDTDGNLRASVSNDGKTFGPRCYTNVDTALQIGLTTEFFRKYYPRGVTNTWIFLMACESMAIGDLGDVFTNNKKNKSVAVLGFDRPVSADFVRPLAREFTHMVGAGYGINKIVDSMQSIYTEDNFISVILGKGGAVTAKLTSGISNPSFAPDIVSLFDPASGHELVDGGSVTLVGAAGDGKPDSLRVVRQVALLGGRVPADAVKLRVEVKGRGAGSDLEPTLPGNAEEFFRVQPDASDLGFDVKKNERLDLTVVATLPGGGESRWTYRNITFAGCSWSLNMVGSSRAGEYGGSQAVFMVTGDITALLIGSHGDEGSLITVSFPTLAVGTSKTIEVGMNNKSRLGSAAAFAFTEPDMSNPLHMMFATGDGSNVRGNKGEVIDQYPPSARFELTRPSAGVMTGRLRGKVWAPRSMQDMRLVKPDVDFRFTAREWMSDVMQAGKAGKMPAFDQMVMDPCGG